MKKKHWFLVVHNDGENAITYDVENWFQGICELLKHVEKGVPFTCKIDFFYRNRGDE